MMLNVLLWHIRDYPRINMHFVYIIMPVFSFEDKYELCVSCILEYFAIVRNKLHI